MLFTEIKSIIICVVFLLQCHAVFSGRVKRVVRGMEVECGVLPRVTSLLNSSLHHICGATLLSAHHAVTAAHCVSGQAEQYLLQLNNFCVGGNGTIPRAVVLAVIVHDKYDMYSRAHDIALLRIQLDLEDTSWLNESILPKSSFGLKGDQCTIAGYGARSATDMATTETLVVAPIKVVSMDECYERLGPYMAPGYDSGMLCAMGDGVDTCQGDSGGPVFCSSTLEGVSSHGLSACASLDTPAVYTSIGAHLRWLAEHVHSANNL